jgi:integrase
VSPIPPNKKPRAEKREAAYFEDAELPKLIAVVDDSLWRTLILVALKTGLRLGELTGLTWGDVDLGGSVVHVRRTVASPGIREPIVSSPKSHEKREVELTEDVVKLLGEWWGQVPGTYLAGTSQVRDEHLVFPRFGLGGYLRSHAVGQALYSAMERAGIPRVGPTGEKRTFHSLRHTYARICLEHGCLETWLQRQLGHSSLAVTTGIYGHWSRSARRLQAAKLEGAFVV